MQINRNKDSRRSDVNIAASVGYSNLVFLSGQVAYTARGEPIDRQVEDTLLGIEKILEQHGADRDAILSATVHLRNTADFDQLNRVWDAFFADVGSIARTTVQAALMAEGYDVEITVVASSDK